VTSGATYLFPSLYPPPRVTKLLAQFGRRRQAVFQLDSLARRRTMARTAIRLYGVPYLVLTLF
jgi:hypothetical protein